MKALLNNNVLRNFANGILNKNLNFGFSQMMSYSANNFFAMKNLNYDVVNKEMNIGSNFVSEIKLDNNKIGELEQSESNVEKIEFKNKSRKVAERKRKKRKTGKDIRIRWR